MRTNSPVGPNECAVADFIAIVVYISVDEVGIRFSSAQGAGITGSAILNIVGPDTSRRQQHGSAEYNAVVHREFFRIEGAIETIVRLVVAVESGHE